MMEVRGKLPSSVVVGVSMGGCFWGGGGGGVSSRRRVRVGDVRI